jgi:predicted hydrocarbon binding protein
LNKEKRRFFAYHFSPKERAYQITVRIRDIPGALSSVLDSLRDHVNLVASVSYSLGDGKAIWSGFALALSKNESEADLKKLVAGSNIVEESDVSASEDGLLVDSFHSGLEVEPEEDFVLFPAKGLSHTYDHLGEILGSGGDTILYEEGYAVGRVNSRYFISLMGLDLARQKLTQLAVLYASLGWGRAEIKMRSSGAAFDVKFSDCFECSAKRTVRQSCSFMRGHLAGFLSTIFESDLESTETHCRFRGDPLCEFSLVQPSPS